MNKGGFQQDVIIEKLIIEENGQGSEGVAKLVAADIPLLADQGGSLHDVGRQHQVFYFIGFTHRPERFDAEIPPD